MKIKAFVDGSFRNGKVGWAVIIVGDDGPIFTKKGFLPEEFNQYRQVAGELKAAMEAARWAQKNKKEIEIHYDYTGIEEWATKRWRAKNKMTRNYVDYMLDKPVKFCKVRAHSGDRWNENVDKLIWKNTKEETG